MTEKIKIYASDSTLLPERMSSGASGFDLKAAIGDTIYPGERVLIRTGLHIEIPHGYEGQIRPRSSLAIKHGITVANAPGTIDGDYRGEICVGLINMDLVCEYVVARGDRIAQLVICPVADVIFDPVSYLDELSPTPRGKGGFGSTGK